MVKKITWKTLITNNSATNIISPYLADLKNIDDFLNDSLEVTGTQLQSLATYVEDKFLKSNLTLVWENLPIYISSWKEYDSRFMNLLSNKLREYIAFYNKVLTDEGVQRDLVYSKTYGNTGSSSTTDRGINSSTPQNSNLYDSQHPESDSLFDQAIADYASTINKDKSSSQSSSSGNSKTKVNGVTWEEAKKNVQMMFFNELKEFIVSIPERIYSWYSLETIPVPELNLLFCEYRRNIWEMINE